jgi:hypothetical protein
MICINGNGILMNLYHRQEIYRTRVLFARALACFLLAGIVYSATFGALHSHKNAAFDIADGITSGSAQQFGEILNNAPLRRSSDAGECLICVLHRQFSNSIIHTPLFIAGPSAEIASAAAPAVFSYSGITASRPTSRLSGRAPPFHRV